MERKEDQVGKEMVGKVPGRNANGRLKLIAPMAVIFSPFIPFAMFATTKDPWYFKKAVSLQILAGLMVFIPRVREEVHKLLNSDEFNILEAPTVVIWGTMLFLFFMSLRG